MSTAASEEGLTPDEADKSAERPPAAAAAQSEAELAAMLLQVAKSIDLEVPKAPSPECWWLDDWFLGAGSDVPPRSTPEPSFPEARSHLSSSLLTTLDGGQPGGTARLRCTCARIMPPPGGIVPASRPKPAYSAVGQAASALHAMAILQVHEAKALKKLHQGGPDPRLMQELRRNDTDKVRFLNALISQASLFGDTQFSAVQKQTEAIKHILPRCESTKPPGAQPPSAHRRGRPPAASTPAPPPATSTQAPWIGGLRPILDLHILNRMLTVKRILSCIRHQDWFAAIDLKDAYFHVSILPLHRPFLRVAFEGRPPVSPHLYQTRGGGIRIFNYLNDLLIIAHSRDLLCEQRDLVLRHLSHLGLQVNWEKSKLYPVQSISFLGMELDSVDMSAHLTDERVQPVLNCLNLFRHKTAVPLKRFQRLLGHIAATAAFAPLGLLHMRPLQCWLYDRIQRWAWHRGFFRPCIPTGRHMVVNTDASKTGWGAVCDGQAASDSWTGPRLQWHINCLELLAVLLALRRLLPVLRDKHVLVRTDNIPKVVYINRQGGLWSRC
ncbi:hypothetical protein M9458_003310, partial [Cirrhinus mrigala]